MLAHNACKNSRFRLVAQVAARPAPIGGLRRQWCCFAAEVSQTRPPDARRR